LDDEPNGSTPILIGALAGCATRSSGHAATTPLMSVVNSRRLTSFVLQPGHTIAHRWMSAAKVQGSKIDAPTTLMGQERISARLHEVRCAQSQRSALPLNADMNQCARDV
jgi:hypothetical protein